MKTITKSNFFMFIGIILHRILLDINYEKIIYPFWSYEGWYQNTGTTLNHILSWVILLASFPFTRKIYNMEQVFLSHAIFLIYLLCFVPGTSLMAFMPMNLHFFILYVIYWFLLLFFTISLKNTSIMKVKHLSQKGGTIVIYTLLVIMSLTVVFISGRYANFRLNLNIADVYDLRIEARTFQIPILLSYIWNISKSILPILFLYFMTKRNKILTLFIGLVIVLSFSINGLKSTLFYLLIALLGYWFFKGKKTIRWYVWWLILISLSGILEYQFFDTINISNMIVRRIEFLPSVLNYYYYDFFATHEFDYLRTSFLRHFGISSPYEIEGIARTIGAYMEKSEMSANNGTFSDAYSNFGVFGILFFPFLLILWIKIMNFYAAKIDEKYLIMPLIVTIVPLISTSLTTCLLTHGQLAILLCLMAISSTQRAHKTHSLYAYSSHYK